MDALCVAAPLARLLLSLGETGREGELRITQRARTATLSLARGRVLCLAGVDLQPLGDTLLALGALDVASQRELLDQPAGLPIGARLVAAGATSSQSVSRALTVQLVHGVDALLRWPSTNVQLVETKPATRGGVAIDLVSTLWSALLGIAARLPAAAVLRLSGEGALVWTAAGKRRAAGLVHASESGALAASFAQRALLGHGSGGQGAGRSAPASERASDWDGDEHDVRAHAPFSAASLAAALAARPTQAQLRVRAVLRVLGAAVEHPTVAHAPEDAYALLLRKTRELARNESAHVLLDLPAVASAAHARRALRLLAQKLHPDRFHMADARLYAVSERVMGALSQAEHALRAHASA